MHEAMDAMITEFADDRLPGLRRTVDCRCITDGCRIIAIDLAQRGRGRAASPAIRGCGRPSGPASCAISIGCCATTTSGERKHDAKVVASELRLRARRQAAGQSSSAVGRGTVLLRGQGRQGRRRPATACCLVTDIKTGGSSLVQGSEQGPGRRRHQAAAARVRVRGPATPSATRGRGPSTGSSARTSERIPASTWTTTDQARYRDAVATLVDGRSPSGLFPAKPPARPTSATACRFCSPDGCRPRRSARRGGRSKRHDAETRTPGRP